LAVYIYIYIFNQNSRYQSIIYGGDGCDLEMANQ